MKPKNSYISSLLYRVNSSYIGPEISDEYFNNELNQMIKV